MEIDLDSINRAGDIVRYRIRYPRLQAENERFVIADCRQRRRAEYFSQPAEENISLYTVYPGTDRASELLLACGEIPPQGAAPAPVGSKQSDSTLAGSARYAQRVNLDSITPWGDRIIYRVRYQYGAASNSQWIEDKIVLADCIKRQRAEFHSVPSYDAPLYAVYPSTDTDKELRIACGDDKPGEIAFLAPPPGGSRIPVPAIEKSPQVATAPVPTPAVSERAKPGRSAVGPVTRSAPIVPIPDRAPSGTGSGFIIGRGYVISNYHVIHDCRSLGIRQRGNRYPAKWVTFKYVHDLALLQVAGMPDVTPPRIRASALLGEDVTVAGHPLSGLLSSDIIVTSGQVNALAGLRDNKNMLQISAPVQPGNSGGPLVDSSGNIVGVVVSKLNAAAVQKVTGDVSQNVNFAIKPEILREFLEFARLPYETAELGNRMENYKIAQRARDFTVQVECYR